VRRGEKREFKQIQDFIHSTTYHRKNMADDEELLKIRIEVLTHRRRGLLLNGGPMNGPMNDPITINAFGGRASELDLMRTDTSATDRKLLAQQGNERKSIPRRRGLLLNGSPMNEKLGRAQQVIFMASSTSYSTNYQEGAK
jgi:hypothetical protein